MQAHSKQIWNRVKVQKAHVFLINSADLITNNNKNNQIPIMCYTIMNSLVLQMNLRLVQFLQNFNAIYRTFK